jgi:hypothetical protein
VLPPIVLACSSDDVANYVFPKRWPSDRKQRARILLAVKIRLPVPSASVRGRFVRS